MLSFLWCDFGENNNPENESRRRRNDTGTRRLWKTKVLERDTATAAAAEVSRDSTRKTAPRKNEHESTTTERRDVWVGELLLWSSLCMVLLLLLLLPSSFGRLQKNQPTNQTINALLSGHTHNSFFTRVGYNSLFSMSPGYESGFLVLAVAIGNATSHVCSSPPFPLVPPQKFSLPPPPFQRHRPFMGQALGIQPSFTSIDYSPFRRLKSKYA